ncbi:hypothetical protein HQQ81_21570 [Microbacteriaceae bacterium VKM Ac-2854]|nr:hypothetical protein [Microbacteriaceae bacterium VKM Ac-2854]
MSDKADHADDPDIARAAIEGSFRGPGESAPPLSTLICAFALRPIERGRFVALSVVAIRVQRGPARGVDGGPEGQCSGGQRHDATESR